MNGNDTVPGEIISHQFAIPFCFGLCSSLKASKMSK